MTITFSPLGEADIEAVIELMSSLYEKDAIAWSEERARKGIGELLAHPEYGGTWVIRADEALAGYLVLTLGYSLEFHGRYGLLDELYLNEEWRGQGLGTAAIGFAVEQCRRWGLRALRLETAHSNTRAQAVYLKNGFHLHKRHLMTKVITG